jgi:hypothetical protein
MEIPEEVVRKAALALAKRQYFNLPSLGTPHTEHAALLYAERMWRKHTDDARAALTAAGVGEMVDEMRSVAGVINELRLDVISCDPDSSEVAARLDAALDIAIAALSSFTGGAK